MANPDKPKADFSGVTSCSDTVPSSGTRADFSGVTSSTRSTAEIVGEAAGRNATEYTVKRGDTLSEIAQAHYGRASQWRRIFEANRDQLDDPDRIQPGQVLVIPARDDD